jgi:hypothetical protein
VCQPGDESSGTGLPLTLDSPCSAYDKIEAQYSGVAAAESVGKGAFPLRLRVYLLFLLLLLGSWSARADVGVVLNDSLDTSIARITGSGHSAVYFSRICPETPIKLRLCRRDEPGSVMSNYTTLGEDQPFEWNIAPLNVYLYGAANAEDGPIFATEKIKRVLEERYREEYLSEFCPAGPCSVSKKAEWREMVAATSERSLYIFVVKTTIEQDEALIAKFNALPNQNHFNGFTRNCANFTRGVVNTYFPRAAHADYINDFGITSPKAIARSFAHYAHHHPDAEYRVLHFAQAPGTFKRSTIARDGTEQLFRSKKLLIPMILVASHELPIVIASYLITGQFNPQREFEQHPSPLASGIEHEIKQAKEDNDNALLDGLKIAKDREEQEFVGSEREWRRYREEFDSLVEEAVSDEVISDRGSLGRVFKELDEKGTPVIDARHALWLELDGNGRATRVGLSPSNIAAPSSDPQLAYQVLLAHTERVFSSPAHSRESMPQFQEEWALLQKARARLPRVVAQR